MKPRPPLACCPRCNLAHRTRNPRWVCRDCETAEIATVVVRVLSTVLQATIPPRTCPHDGCLLLAGDKTCPACLVVARRNAPRRRPVGAAQAPAGWVRKGLVYVKQEVA